MMMIKSSSIQEPPFPFLSETSHIFELLVLVIRYLLYSHTSLYLPVTMFISNCGVFDLATSRITCPYINKTHWFVPGFCNGMGGEEAGYAAAYSVH